MRRLVFPVLLASGLVVVGAVPASAEPAPTASAKAAAGKKMCKITDSELPELSGIVATKNGYVVVNDSAEQEAQRKIFFLNSSCEITKRVDFPLRPRDPEDLVLSPDGKTLWIADTGDNATRDGTGDPRDTIALWQMPADGSKDPKIYRLTYPNGDKHDAEALLLDGDGSPIIVTREDVGEPAGLYVPTGALKAGSETGVPLKKAGELELPRTDTPGSAFARLAQGIVTGGAVSPGGGKVVLRTYLDAFEWDVSNGDVLAALKTKPRGTGLQTDLFGEAITYSNDGKYFYTVSDLGTIDDEDATNYILRYTPATKVIEANAAATNEDGSTGSGASWYADLSLTDITYMVAGVGALGALLVGAGVIGIVRSRKRRALEPPATKDPEPTGGPEPLDAETELLTVGGPQTGVYGGNRPMASAGAASVPATPVIAGAASGPGVYGAKPGPKGNGVYGGARPPQGGQPANRPGPGGTGGRPGQGAPGGRPGQGGPGGRPGQGAPGGRPGSDAVVGGGGGGGQAGRPAGPAGPGGRPPAGRPGQAGPGGGPGPGAPHGRPGQGGGSGQGGSSGRPGQGGAGRPAQAGPAQGGPGQGGSGGGSGQGAPGGRPGQSGPGGGRAPQGGPPAGRPGTPAGRPGQGSARPGQGGAPAGQGGAPAGRPGQGGAPAGRPGQGGAPGGASGGRPPQGGQPGGRSAPGAGQSGGRPGGQPGRPGGGQPPARPAQGGGQPAARPPQGGQPGGRPTQGGGQPGTRPGGQPGARPGQGGGKSGGGVYGAPPPTTGRPGGGSQRPSGFFGQGPGAGTGQPGGQHPGRPDGGRQGNNFGNLNGPARGPEGDFDAPGHGRNQPGR